MSAKLHSAWSHVQHTNDHGIVYGSNANELLNQGHRSFFFIHSWKQVTNAVNDHHVDTTKLIEVLVHGFQNQLHAFVSRDPHQSVGLEPARRTFELRAIVDVGEVLVELEFTLLVIVEQNAFAQHILANGHAQGINLCTRRFDASR